MFEECRDPLNCGGESLEGSDSLPGGPGLGLESGGGGLEFLQPVFVGLEASERLLGEFPLFERAEPLDGLFEEGAGGGDLAARD